MNIVLQFFRLLWQWLTRASLWLSHPLISLLQRLDQSWMRHTALAALFLVLAFVVQLLRGAIGGATGSLFQLASGGFLFALSFSVAFVYFLIQTERERIANGFLYHEDYYNDWSDEDDEEEEDVEPGPPLPEARYIHLAGKVTFGTLIASCLGMALGFSLWCQGLYLIGLDSWYKVDGSPEALTGWLLYALLSIFRAVDIFDTLPTFEITLPIIRHAALASALLVFAFKIFFDLILLSQLRSWWARRSLMRQSIAALQHPLTQDRAAETLRRIGRQALPRILELLETADSNTRISLVYVLGQLKAKKAVPNLLVLLKTSSDPAVRQAVAETLGDIDATEASPALIHSLQNDPDDDVRAQAARSLMHLDNVDAMAVMFQALETETDEEVRSTLIEALGILTPENHFEIMNRVNEVCLKIVQEDRSDVVRRSACQTIGYMELDAAVPVLTQVLRNDTDDDVREAAADALRAIANDDAIPALIEAIKKDNDDDVRASAVYALGTMDAEKYGALLIQLLRSDPSKVVRRNAAYTLGELGIEAAEAALQQALQDPSLRDAARDGLAALYYDDEDDDDEDV